MPIIVTEAPKVKFVDFFDFFLFRANLRSSSVFNGRFKCCSVNHVMDVDGRGIMIPCDKQLLAPVLERMYEDKLAALEEAGNHFLLRIFRCMEPAILAGSDRDRRRKASSPNESIEEFVARFRLPEDPGAGDNSGAPAIEWA